MFKSHLIYSFLFLLLFTNCLSQVKRELYRDKISISNHIGYILPHYKFIGAYVNKPTYSLELAYAKKLISTDEWDAIYNYPEIGINLFYTTLGSNQVFGKEIALVPNFKFNLIHKKRFHLYSRVGLGVNYVTKKFNYENNLQNLAVGSKVNIHFDYKLGATYFFKNGIGFSSGLLFGHYSNSNTATPNLGINYVSTCIGIDYRFNKKEVQVTPTNNYKKFHLLQSFIGVGIRSTGSYSINSSTAFKQRVSKKYFLGGGVDFFYDNNIQHQIGEQADYNSRDKLNGGVFISESIAYKRFMFTFSQGFYFKKNKVMNNSSYFRTSFMYQITPTIYARLSIKTHFFVADYPEFTIGYKF